MYGVLIPVGPAPRELDRLDALVGELARHEDPGEIRLVIVDDAPAPRSLPIDWPHVAVVRTRQWSRRRSPDALSAHVAGTMEGLARARGLDFAVKLDTDAAVIAPFSPQLTAAFTDPGLGVVGSYDRTSSGGTRDWSGWRATIDRATRPLAVSRGSRTIRVRYRTAEHRRTVRRIRDAAYRFAPPGAHCLGGAYAVSGVFLQTAALDWRPWVGAQLGEDVVVGLLCSSAGLRMQSLTGTREPFALSWRGLPGSPSDILAHGHAIVHSVKRDDQHEERCVRAALQS